MLRLLLTCCVDNVQAAQQVFHHGLHHRTVPLQRILLRVAHLHPLLTKYGFREQRKSFSPPKKPLQTGGALIAPHQPQALQSEAGVKCWPVRLTVCDRPSDSCGLLQDSRQYCSSLGCAFSHHGPAERGSKQQDMYAVSCQAPNCKAVSSEGDGVVALTSESLELSLPVCFALSTSIVPRNSAQAPLAVRSRR